MTRELGFDALMEEVCVGWGYCGSLVNGKLLHVSMFIPESGPVTADQFASWLFQADGVASAAEPGRSSEHAPMLRAAFARYMGRDVVDARMLRRVVS